jgi:hypothetical protein
VTVLYRRFQVRLSHISESDKNGGARAWSANAPMHGCCIFSIDMEGLDRRLMPSRGVTSYDKSMMAFQPGEKLVLHNRYFYIFGGFTASNPVRSDVIGKNYSCIGKVWVFLLWIIMNISVAGICMKLIIWSIDPSEKCSVLTIEPRSRVCDIGFNALYFVTGDAITKPYCYISEYKRHVYNFVISTNSTKAIVWNTETRLCSQVPSGRVYSSDLLPKIFQMSWYQQLTDFK